MTMPAHVFYQDLRRLLEDIRDTDQTLRIVQSDSRYLLGTRASWAVAVCRGELPVPATLADGSCEVVLASDSRMDANEAIAGLIGHDPAGLARTGDSFGHHRVDETLQVAFAAVRYSTGLGLVIELEARTPGRAAA